MNLGHTVEVLFVLICIVLFAVPQQGYYTGSPSCLIINEFMTTMM